MCLYLLPIYLIHTWKWEQNAAVGEKWRNETEWNSLRKSYKIAFFYSLNFSQMEFPSWSMTISFFFFYKTIKVPISIDRKLLLLNVDPSVNIVNYFICISVNILLFRRSTHCGDKSILP